MQMGIGANEVLALMKDQRKYIAAYVFQQTNVLIVLDTLRRESKSKKLPGHQFPSGARICVLVVFSACTRTQRDDLSSRFKCSIQSPILMLIVDDHEYPYRSSWIYGCFSCVHLHPAINCKGVLRSTRTSARDRKGWPQIVTQIGGGQTYNA
eukprot:6204883-Pleurochrysis_carterae.AAC.2